MTKKYFLYLKEKGQRWTKGEGFCIFHCCFPYVLSVIPVITYGS